MKKIILLFALIAITMPSMATPQTDSVSSARNEQIQQFIKVGFDIGMQANNNKPLVGGVSNDAIGGLVLLIGGLIARAIEKRIMKKRGKIVDAYIPVEEKK